MNIYSFGKHYYNRLLDRIESQDEDSINQARIKILLWGLTSNVVFTFISAILYFIYGPELQLIRALLAFILGVCFIVAVIKWPVWRQVSHSVLMAMTILIWSNLLLYVQGVNIPTLQYLLLIIVFAFYFHGVRWGLFYSFLTTGSIVLYVILEAKEYFAIPVKPQEINKPSYVFVVCYNFLLIIFLHYHFFKSFIINIRELKKAGHEQKILNIKLQQTMNDLAKSSEAKMNFLSTMSHELRTPLNGVIGLTNVLLLDNPREDQRENLGTLKFSAANLLALINDILDFNKLGSGKITLEEHPTNLTELLDNIYKGLSFKIIDKGIDFKLIVDPVLETKLIICDSLRLTQILLNLVNNAVKFTDRGSVEVIAEVVNIIENRIFIKFIVRDTGIGIPKDQQSTIFNPFTQASASITRRFGGTGLGLAIVKNLINLQGSEIHLKSEEGEGSEFSFEISYPFISATHRLPEEADNRGTEIREIKILVAEDNPVNVMVIKKLLSLRFNAPEIAENGADAVKLVREKCFDLILMDLNMPLMDGYEASRVIRNLGDEEKARIPIIALTASVSEDVVSKVKQAGMDDYLSKPFTPEHLYEKIESLVKPCVLGK